MIPAILKAKAGLYLGGIALAAGVALGGAGVLFWERGPFGLSTKLAALKDAIPAKLELARKTGYASGAVDQVALDKTAFDQWGVALKACHADALSARDRAAKTITKTEANASRQNASAFALGKASCKGNPDETHASDSPDLRGPIGLPAPGDDFGKLVNAAAFTPGH